MSLNPFLPVSKVEIRARQQKRRAFTDDELDRLIIAAPRRKWLYISAAYTGLRFNELIELRVADTALDDERPHFKVRSSTTKNKKDAVVPVHSGLVEGLKSLTENKEPGERLFGLASKVNAAFDRDLRRAEIEKYDALNHKVDFHALRHTFATNLARKGVSQRLVQELMRHSDPRLTAQIYTDASQPPTFNAVETLEWRGTQKLNPSTKRRL